MSRPEISRVSPAYPGETIRVFGENLEGCSLYILFPEERIVPTDAFDNNVFLPTRPADAIKLDTFSKGNQVLFASIPYTVEYGCLLLWVVGSDGEAFATVNKPEIWNRSLKIASPNDRLTLFGRNFFGEDQRYFIKTKCVMKNVETGEIYSMRWGASQDLQQNMPGQNEHKSDYRIPQDVPDGDYLCSMTNGTGGRWGWSDSFKLTICSLKTLTEYCRTSWNAECRQNRLFDLSRTSVKKIPSEYGDGFTDITSLLQDSIDSISQSGGYILLPAGRFGVSETIMLKPGVIIKGAGKGATTLTVTEGKTLAPNGLPPIAYATRASDGKNWSRDWKPFMDRENNTPLIWIQTDSGIEDITLEGGSGCVILTVVGTEDGSSSKGVFFNRVVFENGINSALYNHGTDFDVSYHALMIAGHSDDLTLYKCFSKASFPLMILPAQCKNLRLIGNTFEVSPRQSGDCVFAAGLYGAIITENSFNYGRRSLISQQGMFDCWVFQNRSVGVANTTNANEEYMSEYGQSAYVGTALEILTNGVKLDFDISSKRMLQRGTVGDNIGEHRWFLMIMKGRGYGQYREIDHVCGNAVYIKDKWTVMPDRNTIFNLVTAANKNIWALNFAGLGSGNSQFIYGSGIENIIVGHSVLLAAGISMYAMMPQYDLNGNLIDLGVVAFNEISYCDCRYSGMGLCMWTNESWSLLDDRKPIYTNQIGNIIRWNSLIGGSDSDYVKNQTVWTPVKIASGFQLFGDYDLVERNIISGYDAGIHIRYSSTVNYLINNTFCHNKIDIIDDGQNNTLNPDSVFTVEHGGMRNPNGGWFYDDGRI